MIWEKVTWLSLIPAAFEATAEKSLVATCSEITGAVRRGGFEGTWERLALAIARVVRRTGDKGAFVPESWAAIDRPCGNLAPQLNAADELIRECNLGGHSWMIAADIDGPWLTLPSFTAAGGGGGGFGFSSASSVSSIRLALSRLVLAVAGYFLQMQRRQQLRTWVKRYNEENKLAAKKV